MIANVPDMTALLALATDEQRRVIYKQVDLRCNYEIHTLTMQVQVDAAALGMGLSRVSEDRPHKSARVVTGV